MKTQVKRRAIRWPKKTKDHDGREIVIVPLANSKHPAKLFKESFDLLLDLRVTAMRNVSTSGHIRFRHRSLPALSMARFLTEAGSNHQVAFIDGNPLNLRLDNMRLKKGKGADREIKLRQELVAEREARLEFDKKTEGMTALDRFFFGLAEDERRRAESPFIEDEYLTS